MGAVGRVEVEEGLDGLADGVLVMHAAGEVPLRRVGERFHVEQNRAAMDVPRQVIEEIAEIRIRRVAERYDVREPDTAAVGPVDNSGDQRTRLRDEREIPRQRGRMREAGIETDLRQ